MKDQILIGDIDEDELVLYANAEMNLKEHLKNLYPTFKFKGSEVTGWLGEIYSLNFFGGKLQGDKGEIDLIIEKDNLIERFAIKARRKSKSNSWRRTSKVPSIKITNQSPTHLIFVVLDRFYRPEAIYKFDFAELVRADRFRYHTHNNGYIFTLHPKSDIANRVYPRND